jgi:dissimilatory sulfite reductase (desulfoviridin) alpha/beta subunit
MRWDDDAQAAVSKAPFFVRGTIRRRVEERVREHGRDLVTLEDVQTAKFTAMRSHDITPDQVEKIIESTRVQVVSNSRFYEVKVCGGAFGCPRAIYDVKPLADKMTGAIEASNVPEAVLRRANGPILRHHKLCISISGCPNSCSQPQIADFGIQGRARPTVGSETCSGCGECVRVCSENAVSIPETRPNFDRSRCIDCGDCAAICPTEAIAVEKHGFSVLVGGKLGRHPQLARTLFELTDEKTAIKALQTACRIFAEDLQPGERFANAVDRIGLMALRD